MWIEKIRIKTHKICLNCKYWGDLDDLGVAITDDILKKCKREEVDVLIEMLGKNEVYFYYNFGCIFWEKKKKL